MQSSTQVQDEARPAVVHFPNTIFTAVLFIADDKVLLSEGPDGVYCLMARMTPATPSAIVDILLPIFDLYESSRQVAEPLAMITESDDGAHELYRALWVKVTKPEDRFIRQARWIHQRELESLQLSALARAMLTQAKADGAIRVSH